MAMSPRGPGSPRNEADDEMEAKREYNIRQREKIYEKKQKEALAKKNQAFEQKKQEEQAREAKHLEQQRRVATDAQLKKKTAQVENEYRDRCREVKIAKKAEAWSARANQQIRQIIEEAALEEHERQDSRRALKERYNAEAKEKAYQRGLEAHKTMLLEEQRESIITSKDSMRREKELMRIEKLKAEQRAELEEAMYSQSAVPLKSTLVASLTATPSVSQLLCALKDQTEDYEDLRDCDLEVRAKHQGLPLFLYVKQLREAQDASRYKPPEPVPSDGAAPGTQAGKPQAQKKKQQGFSNLRS